MSSTSGAKNMFKLKEVFTIQYEWVLHILPHSFYHLILLFSYLSRSKIVLGFPTKDDTFFFAILLCCVSRNGTATKQFCCYHTTWKALYVLHKKNILIVMFNGPDTLLLFISWNMGILLSNILRKWKHSAYVSLNIIRLTIFALSI